MADFFIVIYQSLKIKKHKLKLLIQMQNEHKVKEKFTYLDKLVSIFIKYTFL